MCNYLAIWYKTIIKCAYFRYVALPGFTVHSQYQRAFKYNRYQTKQKYTENFWQSAQWLHVIKQTAYDRGVVLEEDSLQQKSNYKT